MPTGTPRIGSAHTSAAEELTAAPEAKVLGTISADQLQKLVEKDPPPPWETDPRYFRHNTDARRFVKVPDNVELRWLNPKLVNITGMRDWQAVPAKGDSRFHLINTSMRAPDNTIRRGGHEGDFLGWMYKSWVESRNAIKSRKVGRATQAAVDRQESLKEEIRRGSFNQVELESAHHPTHTIGEGRSMTD